MGRAGHLVVVVVAAEQFAKETFLILKMSLSHLALLVDQTPFSVLPSNMIAREDEGGAEAVAGVADAEVVDAASRSS